MSRPYPPIEVIRAAPVGGGLRHVSEFIALALGGPAAGTGPATRAAPAATLPGHPGIAKCRGAGLACCSVCVRALTHAAAGQQWIEPTMEEGACTNYASLERYGALIGNK